MPDKFPILQATRRDEEKDRQALGCPASIPWALIAPHERQADRNHYQTLKRLAERGGLSPAEAVAVLEDRPFQNMPHTEAIERLEEGLMPKYSVYGAVRASTYLGDFEADTPEQAIEMALASDAASISVCHACAGHISDPEIDEDSVTAELSE